MLRRGKKHIGSTEGNTQERAVLGGLLGCCCCWGIRTLASNVHTRPNILQRWVLRSEAAFPSAAENWNGSDRPATAGDVRTRLRASISLPPPWPAKASKGLSVPSGNRPRER